MPFPKLISDGLEITCIVTEVDWSTKLAISHYLPGDVTEGLSNIESRRPAAEAMLLTISTKIAAEATEAQALRQTLSSLGTAWVGMPIYSDEFLGSDAATPGARIYDSQKLIDLTVPAIVARDAALIADHTYAPLIVGHITQLPAIEPINGTLALCSVTVTEDSPWDFRVGVFGATSVGFWPDLQPDWSSPPKETPIVDYEFERIGMMREQVIDRTESRTRLTTEAGFSLITKAEVASLLSFYLASRGQLRPFIAPCWFAPDGGHDWPLTDVERANPALVLDQPSAQAPDIGVFRFSDDVLKLDFTTSTIAASTVRLSQVLDEVDYQGIIKPAPQRPARIFLYRVSYDVPGQVVYRFTTCWRPLTRTDDGTYQPAPMLHEQIEGGLDLSNEGLTLNSSVFDGNPLARFASNSLEGRLWLDVYECESDPINPDGAVLRWHGTVAAAPQTGRKYTARCEWLGGLLDREGPNVRIGPACNTCFMSPRCGHSKAALARTGIIQGVDAGAYPKLYSVMWDATEQPVSDALFPTAKVEIGEGESYESRLVLGPTRINQGGGWTGLRLDRPFRRPLSELIGATITWYPECDRSLAMCKLLDPIGWRARFRGHPNIPLVNLSLPSDNAATGGKK